MGAYLEQLMLRDQLDDGGRPTWAPDFFAEHPEFSDTQELLSDADPASQELLLSA